MLATIPVQFDHHMRQGGRIAFRQWLAEHQFSFREGDTDLPIFRYGRQFDDAVAELRMLTQKQSNIYLCNVVQYSSVLTQQTDLVISDGRDARYSDIEQLLEEPMVRGFNVDDDLLAHAIAELKGWTVICGGHSFDETCADAGFTQCAISRVSQDHGYAEPTFFGTISDPSRFSQYWRTLSFAVYFLSPEATVDQELFAQRFEKGRLTDFLIRRGVTFGTMGECHVDDDIACSFHGAVYNFPRRLPCFVR